MPTLVPSLRASVARVTARSLVLAPLVFAVGGGCAAMEQARLDQLDRSVTVSTREPLHHYRRIGMEPAGCQGALCGKVSPAEFERQLEQAASGACYEVVASDEIARYGKAYGGPQFGMPFQLAHPFGVEIQDKTAEKILGGWDAMASFALGGAQPDVRDVVVDELGLEGMLKSSISFGEPDATTGFRPMTVDVKLVDAVGLQGLWQARLDETLMDPNDLGDIMNRVAMDMRDALNRRANACGADPAPVQQQTFSGFQVVEQKIELPDRIHFELGSAKLSPSSNGMLGQVAHFLGTRPDITKVRIEGHTDADGADADNLALSQARADAVRDFLVGQGVVTSRLESVGYGETKPVVPNDTVANKAKNRRVDLIIVK
ncbi:MAG: OmpA family protein [Myxococcota bacterium]